MNYSSFIDAFYLSARGGIFKATKKSPETAHEMLVHFLRLHYRLKSYKVFLWKHKPVSSQISVSNAAGFNKNGEIPPVLLRLLGFDRVVIGTVTKEKWKGNAKPRCKRFEKTQSLVNWMGLPGVGAKAVRNYLESYSKDDNPPLTLNFAPTPKPGMSIADKLSDLKSTVEYTAGIDKIDRYELNISCPNTLENNFIHSEKFFDEELTPFLDTLAPLIQKKGRKLYLKISPDTAENDLLKFLEIIKDYPVEGVTACNTTVRHDSNWIKDSPGMGGASGEAVYQLSGKVRDFLNKNKPEALKIIACGGINSKYKADYLKGQGISEIQIYTPLIFQGFSLINMLKTHS